MAESWFALAPEERTEALAVAAAESGWPANLLEKDIWVVWALQALGAEQQLLETLTFKGGTSGLRLTSPQQPTPARPRSAEKRPTGSSGSGSGRFPYRCSRVLPLAPVSPSSWIWSSEMQAGGSHPPSSSTTNH